MASYFKEKNLKTLAKHETPIDYLKFTGLDPEINMPNATDKT